MRTAFRYEFSDVVVDASRFAVTRRGLAVPMEPKALEVFLILLERHDQLVTKDELLDLVWKDTFVTPNVLSRAVTHIRKAIGDDAQAPSFLETVPTRGYRFIGDVRSRPTSAAPSTGAQAAQSADDVVFLAAPARRMPRLWHLGTVGLAIGAIASLLWWQVPPSQPSGEQPSLTDVRQLTTSAGVDGSPTLSPDGRMVAFSSDRSGQLEIYVAQVSGVGPEQALTHDGGENDQPQWSPDGVWLAYHSRARKGIWVVSANGGTPRQVTDTGSSPAWSADSKQLAFSSDAGGMASQSHLWTVNIDGSGRTPLTTIGKPPGGHQSPAWSPDGRFVAFTRFAGRDTVGVFAVSVATKDVQQLSNQWSFHQQYAPDGRAIFVNAGGRSDGLWRLALDPDGRPAGPASRIYNSDGMQFGSFAIARSGASVFELARESANLWRVTLDERGHAAGAAVAITQSSARSSLPAFSPDGERLAFNENTENRPTAVRILSLDGSASEMLVQDDSPLAYPSWSADGKRILATRGTPPVLTWVDVASRRIEPLALGVDGMSNIRLSPDSRSIAYHSVDAKGNMNVWVRGLDGSAPRQVTFDLEAIGYPVWSPDGRSLAVEVKRGDSTHIAVMPATGGELTWLTEGSGQHWPYSWSPDGSRIAFAGEREGIWNIYTVSRVSREQVPLTAYRSTTDQLNYPAWSPDGRSVVFERQLRFKNLWTGRLNRFGP